MVSVPQKANINGLSRYSGEGDPPLLLFPSGLPGCIHPDVIIGASKKFGAQPVLLTDAFCQLKEKLSGKNAAKDNFDKQRLRRVLFNIIGEHLSNGEDVMTDVAFPTAELRASYPIRMADAVGALLVGVNVSNRSLTGPRERLVAFYNLGEMMTTATPLERADDVINNAIHEIEPITCEEPGIDQVLEINGDKPDLNRVAGQIIQQLAAAGIKPRSASN